MRTILAEDRLVLFIDGAHQRGGRWQHFVYKDEDSFLWGQLDSLPNNIDELTDSKILSSDEP